MSEGNKKQGEKLDSNSNGPKPKLEGDRNSEIGENEKMNSDKSNENEEEDEEMDIDDGPPSNSTENSELNTVQKMETNSLEKDVLDLTSKGDGSKKNPSSPDIIVLSDEEGPLVNGKVNGFCESIKYSKTKYSSEELRDKEKLIRRLHEELRNEEMKLILLKKLRQSQQTHNLAPVKENVPQTKTTIIRTNSQVHNNNTPPPLIRGNQPQLNNKSLLHQSSHHSLNPQRGQSQQSGQGGNPPPLMVGPRSNSNQSSVSIQRTVSRSSPNVSLTYTSSGNQSHSQNSHHDRNSDSQQTPAQRQAAAKLALRKQLEKTLLQIPPPKPPPPEMHFIPNASNQEFVCLVGLETIVNLIIDDPSLKRPPPTAFVCVQCGTDFTPVWKWDNTAKNGKSGGVICENCLTSNQKKAAKAEHTNRLKTAFVKALQQEQEIEQRMSQTSSPTQHSQQPSKGREREDRHRSSHSAHQSFLQAHQQQQQQQHHHQISRLPQGGSQGTPPTAHMLPFNPLLTPQLYSGAYQVPHSKASDLQRQYLLDMIPTPRSMPSIPQGNLNWKM